MDRDDNRNTACACLLFRVADRLVGSLRRWDNELRMESDDEADQMVESLARAYKDSKVFLKAANALRSGTAWDKLETSLAALTATLGTSVIDPWTRIAKNKQRRVKTIRQWKSLNPLGVTGAKLSVWMSKLQEQWMQHTSRYIRCCPPPPLNAKHLTFFVASSTEGLPTARKFIAAIKTARPRWKIKLWRDKGIFLPGEATLESLEKVFRQCDFGIYILTADDKLVIRKKQTFTARGNVIFELGMGIGLHARRRSFIVHEKVYRISDLDGISTLPYSKAKRKVPEKKECDRVAEELVIAVEAEIARSNEQWGQR